MNTRVVRLGIAFLSLLATGAAFASQPQRSRSSAKPILVGLSSSETGVYASVAQPGLRGLRLYADELNAHGGLLGRPIKIVAYDDQSDAATAVRLYTKLISEDRVDLLVGPYSSAIGQAVAAVAEKYRRAMVQPFTSASAVFAHTTWNFQAITPSELFLRSVADIAHEWHYSRMALFVNNTPATIAIAEALAARARSFGIHVVYEQTYPKDASDFTSMVLAAKAARPDVIVGTTYVPDSISLAREVNRQGLRPKLLAFSIGVVQPDFLQALGPLADRVVGNTLWWGTLQTQGNVAFVKAYEKRYGVRPTYQVAMGYSALQVLARAVRRAGTLDQETLRRTIATLKMDTVAGHFRLDRNGRQIGYRSYLMQWQGGKPRLVWPRSVAETPLELPYRR